ncbi:MAG: hypothetical protein M5U19_04325 [Microthrixaceae bacterium]|nr:hypothetical protein [Microthrixaceae bacterium]
MEGGESGILQARYGCVLQGGAQIVQKGVGWGPGNKPVVDVGTGNAQYTQCQRDPETVRDANVDDPMPWDGSKIFTDPGRISSVDGGSVPDPIGDIQPELLPSDSMPTGPSGFSARLHPAGADQRLHLQPDRLRGTESEARQRAGEPRAPQLAGRR